MNPIDMIKEAFRMTYATDYLALKHCPDGFKGHEYIAVGGERFNAREAIIAGDDLQEISKLARSFREYELITIYNRQTVFKPVKEIKHDSDGYEIKIFDPPGRSLDVEG